ncbi:MAG: FAD-dependent oxidoreductase [Oscillospiraceae bacterium]|jgi:2,4-dienoyl-CoA reductase-like NADH-dependent reductase (Old Yellow Enzyme family)/thioredoxin reductase|nr:FAD-dependent oxidoreductase [Oscillospiraceae bacterium]
MYAQQYPNLFKPLKIKNVLIKNRIMSAPNMLFQTIDGRPNDFYIGYIEHKARGGAGIVTLGEANVCDGGNHTPGMETTLENMALYAEMAAAIHEHGAVANVELTHGGASAKPQFNKDSYNIVSPSGGVNPMTGATVRAMTATDMERVATAFADTAEYYLRAGFDTVLVHCGHGWLLTQFLSPIVNQRTDEYGGSLENRMRFPLYVLKTIRERVGPNQALTIRVSGSERRPDGFTPEDIATFLSYAQEYVDMAEVSSEALPYTFATPFMPWGQNVELAETIKKSGKVTIPIFTIGSILDPAQAEEIIASGRADGVSMSRALIADPYLPKKALDARTDEIRPCLRCLNCTDSDNVARHFVCSVNPLAARESRLGFGEDIGTAKHLKKVLIVGGGPAGMQAAITASERGHEVVLVEKNAALGGWLKFTDKDENKTDLRRFKEYLVRKTNRSNVKILLNTEVTDRLIESVRPDNIIVATGSAPVVPPIKGIEKARHASDIYLDDNFAAGENVVIIGGGLIGVEAGLNLAKLGKKVTVLEMLDDYAVDAKNVYKIGLIAAVERTGVNVVTGAKVLEVTDGGVTYEKDGATVVAAGDTVLYAVGMRSNELAYFDLYSKAPFVALVGDGKKVGKVDGAVHGGFFAALDVGEI